MNINSNDKLSVKERGFYISSFFFSSWARAFGSKLNERVFKNSIIFSASPCHEKDENFFNCYIFQSCSFNRAIPKNSFNFMRDDLLIYDIQWLLWIYHMYFIAFQWWWYRVFFFFFISSSFLPFELIRRLSVRFYEA